MSAELRWNHEIPTNVSAVAGRLFTAPWASPVTHVQDAQEPHLFNRICAQGVGGGLYVVLRPAVIPVPHFAEKV